MFTTNFPKVYLFLFQMWNLSYQKRSRKTLCIFMTELGKIRIESRLPISGFLKLFTAYRHTFEQLLSTSQWIHAQIVGLFTRFWLVAIKTFQKHGPGQSHQSCPLPTLTPDKGERSFTMRYSNIIIESLCGNLDVCRNYHTNAYSQSRKSVCMISVTDLNRKIIFKSRFSVALSKSSADLTIEIHFSRENTDHANAPIT